MRYRWAPHIAIWGEVIASQGHVPGASSSLFVDKSMTSQHDFENKSRFLREALIGGYVPYSVVTDYVSYKIRFLCEVMFSVTA